MTAPKMISEYFLSTISKRQEVFLIQEFINRLVKGAKYLESRNTKQSLGRAGVSYDNRSSALEIILFKDK